MIYASQFHYLRTGTPTKFNQAAWHTPKIHTTLMAFVRKLWHQNIISLSEPNFIAFPHCFHRFDWLNIANHFSSSRHAKSLSVGPSRTGKRLVPLEACPQSLPNSATGAITNRWRRHLRHIFVGGGDWFLWQGYWCCRLDRHHLSGKTPVRPLERETLSLIKFSCDTETGRTERWRQLPTVSGRI